MEHLETHLGRLEAHLGHLEAHLGHREAHLGHREAHLGYQEPWGIGTRNAVSVKVINLRILAKNCIVRWPADGFDYVSGN